MAPILRYMFLMSVFIALEGRPCAQNLKGKAVVASSGSLFGITMTVNCQNILPLDCKGPWINPTKSCVLFLQVCAKK